MVTSLNFLPLMSSQGLGKEICCTVLTVVTRKFLVDSCLRLAIYSCAKESEDMNWPAVQHTRMPFRMFWRDSEMKFPSCINLVGSEDSGLHAVHIFMIC